jgi:hypothetical protein
MSRRPLIPLVALMLAALACNLPGQSDDGAAVETSVAETLAALPTDTPLPAATNTPVPTEPTQTPTAEPTEAPTIAPPTATPPAGGISLNCDGTYQRVRIVDQGASGKTISVDRWDGASWVNVWSVSSGDPMLKQLTAGAGWYQFGDCQKLVIVPFQHSNPQLYFELAIYAWDGATMVSAYSRQGPYGEWEKVADLIRWKSASKLGYVNNGPLGPCEWTTFEHTWDGAAFVQTGSLVEPVANCVPAATPTP